MEMRVIPLNKEATESPTLESMRPIVETSHMVKLIYRNEL